MGSEWIVALEEIQVMKLTPKEQFFGSSISGVYYGQGNQPLEVMDLDC